MARRRGADRRRRGTDERRPVRWTPIIGLSAMLFIGGWTLLWFFARQEAIAAFAQWRDSERAFGRIWTCPGERISGFPLGITLTCEHPTFAGPVGNGVVEGSLGKIVAGTDLYFLTRVLVTLSPPLQATDRASKQHYDATWSAAALTLRGPLPGRLERASFEATGLTMREGDRAEQAVSVEQLTAGFKPIARPSDAQSDLEATVDVDGLRNPGLDAVLGSADPARLHLAGFATQVRLDGNATTAQVLGPWSRAGGQVHVQDLDLDKGPLHVKATGRFGLDEEHRLEGRFDAGFSGLGPIADRLGLPLDVLKVGGAIASLLGGGSGGQTDAMDLSVPVTAKNGGVTVGPIRTGIVLPPVY